MVDKIWNQFRLVDKINWGVESMLRAFKKLEKDPDIYVRRLNMGAFDGWDFKG